MLSSLTGSEITAVRIEGIQHEVTTSPGVVEDVTDLVLNLKEVRLRMNSAGPKEIKISKKGPGSVTVADFESPDQTSVDRVIKTLRTVSGVTEVAPLSPSERTAARA